MGNDSLDKSRLTDNEATESTEESSTDKITTDLKTETQILTEILEELVKINTQLSHITDEKSE